MHKTALQEIRRRLLEFPEAQRIDDAGEVWRFGGLEGRYDRATEERKVAFLGAMLGGFDSLLLDYGEDPVDDEVPGDWTAVAQGYWRIPDTMDVDPLYAWLGYGNWVLSAPLPGTEAKPWRFGSHKKPSAVVEAMAIGGVLVALYAFHDNAPWFLYLHPDHEWC